MIERFVLAALLLTLPATVARADRTQVYSLQNADCSQCDARVGKELRKIEGVKKVEFDGRTVEVSVRMGDGIDDAVILTAVEKAGLKAVVGPGKGSYLPPENYPEGADVALLTDDGSRVGALQKLRVPDKYTIFDVFAVWCGPCRDVDRRLREIVAERKDVAVRKLNVVDFDSPLARELGPDFDSLPYVVVFSPKGKRTDIAGADLKKLDAVLSR